jgi:hypothetical protein
MAAKVHPMLADTFRTSIPMARRSLIILTSSSRPRRNRRRIRPGKVGCTAHRNDSHSQRSQGWPSVLAPRWERGTSDWPSWCLSIKDWMLCSDSGIFISSPIAPAGIQTGAFLYFLAQGGAALVGAAAAGDLALAGITAAAGAGLPEADLKPLTSLLAP